MFEFSSVELSKWQNICTFGSFTDVLAMKCEALFRFGKLYHVKLVTLYKNVVLRTKIGSSIFFFFYKMNSLDGLQEYQFIILCQDTTMYLVKYSNQCNDEFSYHSVVLQQYIQYSLLKQSLKLPFNNMLTYADTLSTITLHIV